MAKERAAGKNRRPSLLLCIGRGCSAKKSRWVKGDMVPVICYVSAKEGEPARFSWEILRSMI